MSVSFTPEGPPETVLDPEPSDALAALAAALAAPETERRDAVSAVVARWPRFLDAWVVIPTSPGDSKTIAYVGLVALVLLATTVKGVWRWLVLVPTLYLAAFVWENVMSEQPDVTRFVLLGAILVGVMVTRPSGLLGERRVEIV